MVSENLAPSTGYTIDVRLADGSEQLIPITAPPGGLELQVRDMTGDNVQNDLVLRPALIALAADRAAERRPQSLHGGHFGHFAKLHGFRQPAVRSRQVPDGAALVSFASKAGTSASDRQFLVPKLQQGFLSSFTQSSTNQTDRISVSGRAPPAKI